MQRQGSMASLSPRSPKLLAMGRRPSLALSIGELKDKESMSWRNGGHWQRYEGLSFGEEKARQQQSQRWAKVVRRRSLFALTPPPVQTETDIQDRLVRWSMKYNGHKEFAAATRLEYELKSYVKALECYGCAVDKGHPGAMYNLGLWYEEGGRGGVATQHLGKAKGLYVAAARAGVGMAKYKLSKFWRKGEAGCEVNELKAFELLKEAVRDPLLTSPDAFQDLADMYITGGKGFKSDIKEASKWTQKAYNYGQERVKQNRGFVAALKLLADEYDDGSNENPEFFVWLFLKKRYDAIPQDSPLRPRCYAEFIYFCRNVGVSCRFSDSVAMPVSAPFTFAEFKELQIREHLMDYGNWMYLEEGTAPPNTISTRRCENCDERKKVGFKCMRCKTVYCSRDCRDQHKKIHDRTCKPKKPIRAIYSARG